MNLDEWKRAREEAIAGKTLFKDEQKRDSAKAILEKAAHEGEQKSDMKMGYFIEKDTQDYSIPEDNNNNIKN